MSLHKHVSWNPLKNVDNKENCMKMSAPKTAFWLQIAEYLIFCTRDDKDVHTALLTARKMKITNTRNTSTKIQIQIQKYNHKGRLTLYFVLKMVTMPKTVISSQQGK